MADEHLVLRPFVFWSQDSDHIKLRIDVRNAKDINLNMKIDAQLMDDGQLIGDVHFIEFTCSAFGAFSSADATPRKYVFQLPLYAKVKADDTDKTVRIMENGVELLLVKAEPGKWWPDIMAPDAKRQKAHGEWLKFDFAQWKDNPEDEEEQEEDREEAERKNPYIEQLMRELEQNRDGKLISDAQFRLKMNMLFSTYLFLYNMGMFLLNFYILCSMLFKFVSFPRSRFLFSFWTSNFRVLVLSTLLQYIDVFHSLVGLTKAGYRAALLQITGRLAVLLIIDGCGDSCACWSPVFSLVLTYLTSEQFRYPYYALSTLGVSLPPITWLRFNAWLYLYPLGLFLEGLVFLRAIPVYYSSGVYSLSLPNPINFGFNFGVFLALFTFTCFPYIGFTLLKHMNKQRRAKMDEMRRKERTENKDN